MVPEAELAQSISALSDAEFKERFDKAMEAAMDIFYVDEADMVIGAYVDKDAELNRIKQSQTSGTA